MQLTNAIPWGGLFIFIFLTAIVTENALLKLSKEHDVLASQLTQLEETRTMALETNQKLRAQINSQSDIAWIELVLKRELGLIPEGQTKVLFIP